MITKRKLKNGKHVYDATVYVGVDENGSRKRKKVTCKTKHEAEYEEAKLIAHRASVNGKTGHVKLSVFVDDIYWPQAHPRLEASSRETYRRAIDKHILPSLGKFDLVDIDKAKIQAMLRKCGTESVARKSLGVLKTVLNEAVAEGRIISNPATAKFSMPKKGCKHDDDLVLDSFDQIGELLEIVSTRGSWCVQRLAYTGLLLGLRPEERYALDWECFKDGFVHVKRAYTAASSKYGGNQLKKTKTELSNRVIPLPEPFEEWFSTQGHGSGPFILGGNFDRITPSTAQKRWRRFLKDNPDAPQVTLENMRHSFATSYLANGGRVETLSRILGHSDINTTLRRYVRPGVESLRKNVLETVSLNT